MPNFFPEGNSPFPTDSEERSLLKAVSLLQSIAAGGGGSGGGNGSTNYELKSAHFTAETGKNYAVDTTSGVVSVTLPSNPQTGDVVGFADARGTWASNPITILRNGKFIEGSTINFSNNAAGTFFVVLFIDNSTGWRVLTSGTKPLNLTAPTVSGTYDFTSTNGTWTGSPTSYSYQWQMSANGTSGWANINGATSSTYLAVEADEGKYVRVGVVATNSNGPSVVTYSAASNPINVPDFPTTGLLAFWKLDDVNDSSGNANTLTNTNSVTFSAGKIGNAAQFGGFNSLSSSQGIPSGDFTISFWIKASSFNSGQPVGQLSNGAAFFGDTNTIFFANSSGANIQISGPLVSNDWTHVLVRRSTNTFTIWTSGVLRATQTNSVPSTSSPMVLGNQLSGQLDAVGIWNRALTDQEIALVYNNGSGVEP